MRCATKITATLQTRLQVLIEKGKANGELAAELDDEAAAMPNTPTMR